MNITRINTLVTSVAGGASRRHLVQMLAGGAVGGLTTAVGITSADAKKKKRKKPKNGSGICPIGTLVATVMVPANGKPVSTPALESRQRYRLRAVGVWSTNVNYGNDAFAAFRYTEPNVIETTSNGVRVGLSVDEESPELWGKYNPDHIYVRQVTGGGDPLTLEFTDATNDDNAGSLVVDIFCD